jgi:hypothetical protein
MSAASFRLAPTNADAASAAIDPVFRPGGADGMVRFIDSTTRLAQYFHACGTGVTGANLFVDTDTRRRGSSDFGVGSTINPVTTVRWQIAPRGSTSVLAPFAHLDDINDPLRLDLYRSYISAQGAEVGTELVAEYAVDLKFAFTYAANGSPSSTLTTLAFTDNNAVVPPELIRAVRVRLATRSAQGDRAQALSSPVGGFLMRYCLDPNAGGDAGACPSGSYSRVRTLVTEVAVQNNGKAWY